MKTSAAKAYRRPSPAIQLAILPLCAGIGCAQARNTAIASGRTSGINTGADL
jgi:hypothetical protein